MTTTPKTAPVPPALQGAPGGRDAVLAGIENEKLRAMIAELRRPDAYDWSRLFPKTGGWGAAGDVKRRVKMLRSVEPRYDYLLYPDERIEFVTKGVLNNFVEQYFMGIWSLIINRTLFLFTNMRVILLQCNGQGQAKTLMWQIPYHRMGKYGGMLGNVKIKVEGESAYSFSGVPGDDRKRLRQYMTEKLEQVRTMGVEFPSHSGRDSLCPACATPVPATAKACTECNEAFVNPSTPATMSLFLPGLGHMYLGHYALGIIETVSFGLLLMFVAMMALAGTPEALVLLGVANGVDAAVTYHVAKKGKMLKKNAWRG